MGRSKIYDKEYPGELIILGAKIFNNIEKLKKEHPMECDVIVAEVLTWVADLISEYDESYTPYTRIVAEKALKKVATDYPGLLHREALCETIGDFLYQLEGDWLMVDSDNIYYKKER